MKRIRKTYNGVVPNGKILNSYSDSQNDGYSCDYINGLETYSTDEVRVGTWIDGKPLYRKVINMGQTVSGSVITIQHGIQNIDFIRVEDCFIWKSTSKLNRPINIFNNTSSNFVQARSTDVSVLITSNQDPAEGAIIYMIVNYTKTTD